MLKHEAGNRIIHCDICNTRLPGPAVAVANIRELTGRARLQLWRVERVAGEWKHTCPAHPPERNGKFI